MKNPEVDMSLIGQGNEVVFDDGQILPVSETTELKTDQILREHPAAKQELSHDDTYSHKAVLKDRAERDLKMRTVAESMIPPEYIKHND